jgi:hypothetical protein
MIGANGSVRGEKEFEPSSLAAESEPLLCGLAPAPRSTCAGPGGWSPSVRRRLVWTLRDGAGCEIINVVGHGRLVCATSLFRQLRAIRGVDLTAEEEGVLIALAGVKSSDSSVETALDFDRVSSLLRGETESQSMPEPEPEPDYPETLQLVGQNSADERARRNAADIELAAVLAATAATDRELAQVQLQIECAHKPGKQMQSVEVQTWSEWDAAVLAATDSANPPPALFVKSAKTGGEETVGQVLKVDGHRVRVEWTASGKKQWTTKRDLRVGR